MAFTKGDFDKIKPKKKRTPKYMSKLQVTYEVLPELMNLALPEGIQVKTVYSDPSRELLSLVFHSHERVHAPESWLRLFEVGEASEIPNQSPTEEHLIEEMRRKVAAYDERKAGEKNAEV